MPSTLALASPHRSPPDTEQSQRGTKSEFYLFALWVLVTFTPFRFDELLLYPLALYFAYAVWRNQVQVLMLLRRAWILLVFPIWCLLSPLWAVEPMIAFKQALYLILTMLICFQVAISLSPREIMYAILLATGVIVVTNLLRIYSPGGDSDGFFIHKNQMGKNMVVAWTVALATTLDKGSRPRIRWIACGVAALSLYTALISESATAVLLVAGTAIANLFGAMMLQGGGLRAGRLAILCFLLGGMLGTASLVLPQTKVNPIDPVLSAFGKDRSLTGRTGLWDYAEQQIEEKPLLGVGAGGFWRYHASPLVRRIYEEYHKEARANFNFHNSYYEFAVHQGLIGAAMVIVSIIWAWGWIIRGAVVVATMPQICFFSQSLAVFVRTFTEADFLAPFVIFHMIFWIGALSTLKLVSDRASGQPQTVSEHS